MNDLPIGRLTPGALSDFEESRESGIGYQDQRRARMRLHKHHENCLPIEKV